MHTNDVRTIRVRDSLENDSKLRTAEKNNLFTSVDALRSISYVFIDTFSLTAVGLRTHTYLICIQMEFDRLICRVFATFPLRCLFSFVVCERGASARTKTAYTHVRVSCGLAVCHILFGKQFSLYFALLLVFIYDCHYLNICLASPRNFDKLLSPGEKIFFCFDFTVKKSVHLNIALKTMKTQYYTFLSFRTFFFYCSTTHQPPQPIHLKKLLYNTSCILAAT